MKCAFNEKTGRIAGTLSPARLWDRHPAAHPPFQRTLSPSSRGWKSEGGARDTLRRLLSELKYVAGIEKLCERATFSVNVSPPSRS